MALTRKEDVLPGLIAAAPSQLGPWEDYLAGEYAPGDERLLWVDAGEVGRRALDLLRTGNIDELRGMFEEVERALTHADEEARNLIVIGFLEGLQFQASWEGQRGSPIVEDDFKPFLGRVTLQAWEALDALWSKRDLDALRVFFDRLSADTDPDGEA